MNNREALQVLVSGGRVRLPTWRTETYLYLSDDGVIFVHYASGNELAEADYFSYENEWKIYEEPKRKVKYAECMYYTIFKGIKTVSKSVHLFKSEQDARQWIGEPFIGMDWDNAVEVEE